MTVELPTRFHGRRSGIRSERMFQSHADSTLRPPPAASFRKSRPTGIVLVNRDSIPSYRPPIPRYRPPDSLTSPLDFVNKTCDFVSLARLQPGMWPTGGPISRNPSRPHLTPQTQEKRIRPTGGTISRNRNPGVPYSDCPTPLAVQWDFLRHRRPDGPDGLLRNSRGGRLLEHVRLLPRRGYA